MAQKQKDNFANKFYGTVVESAANTLTFQEIQTNVDVFSKRAWVLHRLEWYIAASNENQIAVADDVIRLALTSSDKITALDLSNPGVIDLLERYGCIATAVGFEHYNLPHIRDFTSLPGGGLIISPRPLFVAVKGTSLASAVTASVRGYFTAMDLSADEYLELVDFYRIVS